MRPRSILNTKNKSKHFWCKNSRLKVTVNFRRVNVVHTPFRNRDDVNSESTINGELFRGMHRVYAPAVASWMYSREEEFTSMRRVRFLAKFCKRVAPFGSAVPNLMRDIFNGILVDNFNISVINQVHAVSRLAFVYLVHNSASVPRLITTVFQQAPIAVIEVFRNRIIICSLQTVTFLRRLRRY